MKPTAKYFLPALFALLPLAATAQNRDKGTTPDERQRWITELRNYKHEYLAKELSLSKSEQDKFFPIYDEMDDELTRIDTETRELENKALSDDNATETELNAAAHAAFSQKQREGEVEMLYYDKIKEVISPRQLLRLKNAERKFKQQLLRHHTRMRKGRK